MHWIHFIPIGTFALSLAFATVLLKHWLRKRSALYILWWFIGVLTYAAGTLTESINTLAGWSELNFRWWYITGALLGGAPLAQGTVYLLLKKNQAHFLTILLITAVIVASVCVWNSPVAIDELHDGRLSGSDFEWQWVRRFSPFINLYAVLFLVGGAIHSAVKYLKTTGTSQRFYGNLFIALGAILPGIGGSFTRMGYVEVLYVTEFLGLALIMAAYTVMRKDDSTTVHAVQQRAAGSVR